MNPAWKDRSRRLSRRRPVRSLPAVVLVCGMQMELFMSFGFTRPVGRCGLVAASALVRSTTRVAHIPSSLCDHCRQRLVYPPTNETTGFKERLMWDRAGHWKSAALAVLVIGLAACGDDPAGPGTDQATADIAITEDLDLQVAVDDVVADVTVEDAALFFDESPSSGPWAEARELFRQARQAWHDGDTELAAELAMQGRLVISQAIIDRSGEEGLDALFDRVEDLLTRLAGASDEYERLADLAERISELLGEATVLRDDGDLVGAGERLILALGMADRMRHRHQDARRDPQVHAEAAVAAATIIFDQVVEEIGSEPGDRVAHALRHAGELIRRANVSLENQNFLRAIVLSRRSVGWSFRALRLSLL